MRRKLTLTMGALALIAAPVLAQQVAPYGDARRPLVMPPSDTKTVLPAGFIGSRSELDALLGGGGKTDGFEGFNIEDFGATNTDAVTLDENSIVNGQGPGLVNDGATYITSLQVQWNGNGYFNLPSRTILSNSGDNSITIRYDEMTQAMGIDLLAFNGYGDTATVEIFDLAGAPIASANVTIPGDATPLFIGYQHDDGIGSVRLTHTNWPWSPVIDNHSYGLVGCASDECNGGEQLKAKSRQKGCGCLIKAVLTGGTAGKSYGFSMPGGTCIQGTANSNGKAKAKLCPGSDGTISVPTCGLEAEVHCP